MDRYEFRYRRYERAIIFTVLAFAPTFVGMILAMNLINFGLAQFGQALIYLFSASFFVFLLLAEFNVNADGFAVLHKDHVEINLDSKEYIIKYADITKIKDGVFIGPEWEIQAVGLGALSLDSTRGLFGRKKNFYPLELFMFALKKRVPLKVYI